MNPTTLCVIGLGYIGLPTAAIFAKRGWSVIGVDVNRATVEIINRGEVHIIEPDLDAAVHEVVCAGKLRAALEPEAADAFLVAVPTPFKANHEPDLSFIEAASRALAPVLKRGDLIVLESTSPVGATEKMAEWLSSLRPDLRFPDPASPQVAADVFVAHCPERVLPGNVLHELVHNNRIIGGLTPACADRAAALYRTVAKGECIITNARAAEMCKLAENSFRDVNIAFANELSLVCDRLGIDVWEVIGLANQHPRVNILQPGPGVGGHCIAVDPWFIVSSAPEESRLIRTARLVNDTKPEWVISKVEAAVSELAAGRDGAEAAVTVACLGLAFKADIDDLRESPAVAIAAALGERLLGRVVSVEPNIDALPKHLAGMIELASVADALAVADVIVLLVDHQPFRSIDRALIRDKAVIDTRGFWR